MVVQSSALTLVLKEACSVLQGCITTPVRAASHKSQAHLPFASIKFLKMLFSQKCLILLEIVHRGSSERRKTDTEECIRLAFTGCHATEGARILGSRDLGTCAVQQFKSPRTRTPMICRPDLMMRRVLPGASLVLSPHWQGDEAEKSLMPGGDKSISRWLMGQRGLLTYTGYFFAPPSSHLDL